MNAYDEMIKICGEYINEILSVEEFQKEIEILVLPDVCKKTLEKAQHNAVNKLEEIQFCYDLKEQKKMAKIVAEELIYTIKKYILEENGKN